MKLLNICLAAITAASTNALLIEIIEPEIRAAKDASAFSRGIDDDGPQSLVLVEENLFVHAVLNATGVTVNLTADWEIESSGVVYSFPPFTIFKDGLYDLDSEFGFDTNVNWVKTTGSGVQTIEVRAVVNGTVFDAVTTIYAIGTFQTLLPLLSLVVLALFSRNVYVAMFFGIWIGSLVIEQGDVVESFKALFDKHIFPSVLDEYNFRTITFTLFLAGFIAMVKHSGGQEGFSRSVARIARSARTTQFAALLGGIGLFFDDYSSALILGASFKKLTDAYYVSREKLAFIVDSTSAPIASFAPISSWIAFELGRIQPELENIQTNSQFKDAAASLPDAYTFFINTLPSRYYSIYIVFIQVVLATFAVEFGPMLYAERKCRIGKRTDGGDGATDLQLASDITDPAPDTPKLACNFFVPLLFFIASLLGSMVTIGITNIETGNEEAVKEGNLDEVIPSPFALTDIFGSSDSFFALVYTTMGASLFTLIFYLVQAKHNGKWVLTTPAIIIKAFDCRVKKMEDVASSENLAVKEHEGARDDSAPSEARPLVYFIEGINVWIEGFKNLVPSILILCLAFTIKSIVKGCATDRFFTDIIVNGDLPASSLPTIIFIISSFLSFCTGTSFGTMSIMFPLVSFATFEKAEGDVELFTVAMSAILAGSIFGDHCSPISDTTILSCIGSGCSIGTHVLTQIPYALWGALFSIVFGTLPAGSGWAKGGVMVLGFLAITFGTLLVGAPIVSKSGRLDKFSELYLFVTKSESLKAFKVKTREFAEENPGLVNGEPLELFLYVVTLGFLRKSNRGVKTNDISPKEDNEVPVKQDADVAVVVAESKEGHSL